MNKTLISILDEQKIGDICGVNDKNLHYIENLLGIRLYTRGNELLLENNDKLKKEILIKIIDQMKEHVNIGNIPDNELINSIYRNVSTKELEKSEALKKNVILFKGSSKKVFPKTQKQAIFIDSMNRNDIVFCIGPAGTGKTYLAVAHALNEILDHSKKKLVLVRPIVEAGESLGFLPGKLEEKVNPYLKPLYDAMDDLIPFELTDKFEKNRIIEITPLAYMRGRSLNNSYIILDEAQNTTKEQMKMFLTRIGYGSKAVITGDITQIDLNKKEESGLIHVMNILNNIDGIKFIQYDSNDVVRNPLVKKIIFAYEKDDKK